MLKSFLESFGSILGLCAAIGLFSIAVRLYRKKKYPPAAPAKVWKEYFTQIMLDQEFEEAAIVHRLIAGKDDEDQIMTPKGYKVVTSKRITMEDKYEQATFGLETKYKIEKIV